MIIILRKMGLKCMRVKMNCCFLISLIVLNINFSFYYIQVSGSNNNDNLLMINTALYELYDLETIGDMLIISELWDYRTINVSNPSKSSYINYRWDDFYSQHLACMYNNGTFTFMGFINYEIENYNTGVGYIRNDNYTKYSNLTLSMLLSLDYILVKDNYLFLFGKYYGAACESYSLKNITHPKFIHRFNLSSDGYQIYDSRELDFHIHQNYLYFIDFDHRLFVYDFSNLSQPILVKEYNNGFAKKIILSDNILYVINETNLTIFNNSNPMHLEEISSCFIQDLNALCVNDNRIVTVSDNHLFTFSISDEFKIKYHDKIKVNVQDQQKFFKLIIKDEITFVLANLYITDGGRSYFYIFDIGNLNRIHKLYPGIKLSIIEKIYLFYSLIIGTPILLVIVLISIIIVYNKKRKSKQSHQN